jgi:hypothetical protein
MKKKWDQATIQQYINDGVEESRTTEYKAADALDGAPRKRKEIAKDVSAMANSAGGIIIYGVQEYRERDKRHLPKKIDPIDRTQFSRETLENIITDNIQPRIEGVTIHPVSIGTEPNGVVYVVEIPQSTTAHQVTKDKDYKYYKRFNFKAVPMADDEIRDVMNRATIPDVQVKFGVTIDYEYQFPDTSLRLRTVIKNQGIKVVNHYKLKVRITSIGSFDNQEMRVQSSPAYTLPDKGKNVTWDFVPSANGYGQADILITYRSTEVLFPNEELNISSAIRWGYHRQEQDPRDDLKIPWIDFSKKSGWFLEWVLYADNMPSKKGETPIYKLEGF